MVINVVIKPCIDVVNLAFYPQKNLLVLCVLLSVPLVESGQPPHQGPTNNSDDNRNPPHLKSHPTIPNGLGINASGLSLSNLSFLALLNRRTMEIILAMGEPQADATYMAFKANSTPTWKHVEGEQIAAFFAINRTHHI